MMSIQGQHLLADFDGCRRLEGEEEWRRALLEAVDAMGATLVHLQVHLFQPEGLTAFALLAESHLAVHTWPERDYVAIDIFTCGTIVQPQAGIDLLREVLRPERERIRFVARGEDEIMTDPECGDKETRGHGDKEIAFTNPHVSVPPCPHVDFFPNDQTPLST